MLVWLHSLISNLGYCKLDLPEKQARKGSIHKPKRYIYRFRTYTFSSFNWIYSAFYEAPLGRKSIPPFIAEYLTPLSLAIWIMDDGCFIKDRSVKSRSDSFTLQ